jgi:hypothetical protein
MDFAFRDFVLTREARKRGMEAKPEVRLKVRLFKDYLLHMALRRSLVRHVTVTEEEVLEKYGNERESRFPAASLDEVKDILRNELLRKKRLQAVPFHIQELRRSMFVEKDVEKIHAYYDGLLSANPPGSRE